MKTKPEKLEVRIEFSPERERGGYWHKVTATRDGVITHVADCWRRGSQKEIRDYHNFRFVKRFRGLTSARDKTRAERVAEDKKLKILFEAESN